MNVQFDAPSTTYCIARLLSEELREPDHLGVIVELVGQIDHVVCLVLLFTGT